jgi:hypothetical protein
VLGLEVRGSVRFRLVRGWVGGGGGGLGLCNHLYIFTFASNIIKILF